jgi:hypothetical protein
MYTQSMANEDSVLDERQDNTKGTGQRLRASLNLLRSQGMLDDNNYRELTTRLSTALAMTKAAYVEARRLRDSSLLAARAEYAEGTRPCRAAKPLSKEQGASLSSCIKARTIRRMAASLLARPLNNV